MKVYKECCKNCLLSPDSIVSPNRRREIINNCVSKSSHFICHKASMRDEDVCCKTFYDELGHTVNLIRIAQRLNMVEFVEQPDTERLPSYKEQQNEK